MATEAQKNMDALLANFLEEAMWYGTPLPEFLGQYALTEENLSLLRATIKDEITSLRIRADVTIRVIIHPHPER